VWCTTCVVHCCSVLCCVVCCSSENSSVLWCAVVQVTVHYPNGRQQLVIYRQAFTGIPPTHARTHTHTSYIHV